jgi:hypothetical protein
MKVKKIEANAERQLLIAIIMSTSFLKKIHPIIDYNYFETRISATIANWVFSYFEKFGRAPKAMMQDIYEENKKSLSNEDREWVTIFLEGLSQEYEKKGFNEEFVFENSLRFFKTQKMKKGIIKIEKLLDKGKVEEAEKLWLENRTIPTMFDLGFNPFTEAWVDEVFKREEIRVKAELGIEALDEIIGPIKSSWFILFMGPQKRGKTWALIWAALQMVMQGLDVVFYSFEGEDEDWTMRAWSMITAFLIDGEAQKLEFPYFADDKGNVVKYKKKTRPVMTPRNIKQSISKFNKFAKGNLIVKNYPMGSAGVRDAKAHLDAMGAYHNFYPHAAFFDYVGIMNQQIKDIRERYNITGMELKALAQERKMIVVSGHQGRRETLDKLNMNATDMPEDIRLLGHVDILCGINQTEEERKAGIIRYSALIHRHKKYATSMQAKVLQQLDVGQVVLDSKKIKAPELETNSDNSEYLDMEGDDDFPYA